MTYADGGGGGGGWSFSAERIAQRRETLGGRLSAGVSGSEPSGLVRVADPCTATLPSGRPPGLREKPSTRGSTVPATERSSHLRKPSRLSLRCALHRLDVPGPRMWKPQWLRGLHREQPLQRRPMHRRRLRGRERELRQGLSLSAGRPPVRRHLGDMHARRTGCLVLLGNSRLHRAREFQSYLHAGHLYATAPPIRSM